MADRLAEQGAVITGVTSSEPANTVSRLGGAGAIESNIIDYRTQYTSKVSGLTAKGRWINAMIESGLVPAKMYSFISGVLDSSITFSRSSNATIINSDGNIAYAPHNLLTNSESFEASSWTKLRSSITANVTTAPDGTSTADKLVEDTTASNTHFMSIPSSNFVVGVNYVVSIYAKLSERKRFILGYGTSSSSFSNSGLFDLENNVVTGAGAFIEKLSSDWYRCSLTFTGSAGNGGFIVLDNGTTIVYTGDGTSGLYIWGAQLEIGSTATTYNPTTPKNLLGFTEEFDNAAWTKSNSSIDSVKVLAPNGFLNAQKLVEDTATSNHFFSSVQPSAVVGSVHTTSIYVKAAERTWCILYSTGSATGRYFNLADGTKGNAFVAAPTSDSITSVGNGWYRISITSTLAFAASGFRLYATTGNGVSSYTGDGTSGIYVYGAQLSDSASLDPYVYNPAAALTSVAYYGPRFTYDPVTKAPQGLLIEEAKTNLALYSNDYSQATWSKSNITISSSAATSPDGTNNAFKILETNISNAFRIIQNITFTAGSASFSIFAKQSERKKILLREGSVTGACSTFDLSNGTVVSNEAGGTGTIKDFGNGWYRCTLTWTMTASASNLSLYLMPDNATGLANITYAGDSTKGLFVYGAQLEAGAFATSYIPTGASTVTRAADIAVVQGNNFSNWYNQTEGSVYISSNTIGGTTFANQLYIGDGTANNRHTVFRSSSDFVMRYICTVSGTNQADLTRPTINYINNNFKYAIGYKINDFGYTVNGSALATDTAGNVPTANQMIIFNTNTGMDRASGTIQQINYYNTRLSDAQLQVITA